MIPCEVNELAFGYTVDFPGKRAFGFVFGLRTWPLGSPGRTSSLSVASNVNRVQSTSGHMPSAPNHHPAGGTDEAKA